MTDTLKPQLLSALRDVATYPGKYIWRRTSMQKLEAMRLTEKTGEVFACRYVYRITDAGRAALARCKP